ncbi:hypothetical protein DFH06DRAFT_1479004 [Mycena polygramma]|nr:hypothetical protein DFH06DRAFT_1479004 [Mycena polygramma]
MPLSGAPSLVPQANVQPPALDSIPGPGTDFTRLLGTNDVPLDFEIPFIQAVVSRLQEKVDRLTNQIAESQAEPHRLVGPRTQLTQSIRQHRAMLSAVRRVPPELLCEVFALTVSGNEALPKPPWYLGHVCQSWRCTALAFPPIWASINIPNSSTVVFHNYAAALSVETLLLRSAGAPLKIYWTAKKGTNIEDRCAAAVVSHCHRWNALHLRIPCPSAKLAWLQPASGCLAALRTLQVAHDYPIEFPEDFSFDGRRLREVLLSHYGQSPVNLTAPTIPWQQITQYRGAYPFDMQRQVLLAMAPKLQQCAISFTTDPPQNAAPITLPRLRRLEIDDPTALVSFTAPALKELLILSSSWHSVPALGSFVHRSSCSLKKLILRDCALSPDMIAALGDLPHLTYLLIDFDGHDYTGQYTIGNDPTTGQTALFTAMTAEGGSRDVCPSLVTLVYGLNGGFSRDLFLAMARSRFHSGCLTYLRLYSAGLSDLPLLQELRDEGFDAAVIPGAHTAPVYEQLFTFDGNVHCPYEP